MRKAQIAVAVAIMLTSLNAMASDSFETAGKAMWIVAATDVISTEVALSNGAIEGNPLLKNRAARIGIKVGTTFAVNKLTEKMHKKHPKAANVIRWSIVGAMAFISGHNITVYSW